VFSYLILGGKCRFCKVRISIVYPIVEALTAVSLIALWEVMGITALLLNNPWHQNILPLLQIASLIILIPISVIDLRHYIIPDRFSLTFLALGLAVSFIPGGITPVESLIGALAGGGTLFAMGMIGTLILKKGDAMGMGDVKLMAFLGALWGYKAALFGIAFGAFFGSLAGGVLIFTKKLNDDHRIPFGPFLGAGTVAAIFFGDTFFNWYMGLFT
jgi:leader peptidase (prepilin peptidase)/N-methyltransferase